jgi:hypothetical protein
MLKIKKTKTLLVGLLCAAIHVSAQPGAYEWQSMVRGLKGEGYYRLLLSPDVRARAASDGADIRFVDSTGDYVPYLLRSETPVTQAQDLTLLPVRSTVDAKTETIIIENKSALKLSQLTLTLRNKAQSTPVQLSGSEDGQQWFDINSDIVLSPSYEMHADTFDQQISFPPVSYKYLRLTVRVYKSIPVNIIKAAVQKPVLTSGKYSAIPAPKISQHDSVKNSYVLLDYGADYTIDRISINVTGPRFYHRQIGFYVHDTSGWQPIATGLLSSGGGKEMALNTRTKQLLIVIENEDNKSLHVDSVLALQLNSYLISYLDADRNYFVVFGNAKAQKPNYDLAYFEDSIRSNVLKEINCGPISKNTIIPNTEPVKKATAVKGLNKWWIWPVLIGILVLLLFFTLKVSKDINRKP